jgi:DNA-binding IclR family transcriptional regulator
VLDLFAAGEHEVGVATLGQRLGWPKSTSSRVLLQMANAGLLERDAKDRQYRLGPLVRRLALADQQAAPAARERIRNELALLSAQSGHAAHLSALDGTETVLLEHFAGPNPLQVMSPIGSRLPASVTAMGRALLARLTDADFNDRYGVNDRERLPGSPARCPQTVGALRKLVLQARRERSAVAVDEALPGVAAVATTLRDESTRTTYGLALSFPSQFVSAPAIARYRDELVAIALRTGAQMGDPWWTAGPDVPGSSHRDGTHGRRAGQRAAAGRASSRL